MRFWSAAFAVFAAVAVAQNQQNQINVPEGQSTLDVTAGQPITITWRNPSSGTVTIKLQQSNSQITPQTGIVVASSVPASDGTATFTIDPQDVNSFQYTIEIIDDSNPNNYNFSPNFGIQGAEATGISTGSSTATSTGASSSGSSSGSASASGTTTGDSSSTITGSNSSSATGSSSSTRRTSSTATSSAATETTSAPSAGGAAGLTVPAGFLALVAGAAALL